MNEIRVKLGRFVLCVGLAVSAGCQDGQLPGAAGTPASPVAGDLTARGILLDVAMDFPHAIQTSALATPGGVALNKALVAGGRRARGAGVVSPRRVSLEMLTRALQGDLVEEQSAGQGAALRPVWNRWVLPYLRQRVIPLGQGVSGPTKSAVALAAEMDIQRAAAGALKMSFSRALAQGISVKAAQDTLHLQMVPQGANTSTAAVEGGVVIYPDAFPHTHLLYAASPWRIEEFLLMRNAKAPSRFTFELRRAKGLGKVEQIGERFVIKDAAGVPQLGLEKPIATDARGQEREGTLTLGAGCASPTGSCLVTVALDTRGLAYPILLDPTLVFLTPNAPTTRHGGNLVATGTGKVYAMNGRNSGGFNTTVNEYDARSGKWAVVTTTGTPPSVTSATATLLKNGKILITGGETTAGAIEKAAHLFDPATSTWSAAGDMGTRRFRHTATLLQDGTVLVVGGRGCATTCTVGNSTAQDSAELYNPTANTFSAVSGSAPGARYDHTATAVGSSVFVVGGFTDNQAAASVVSGACTITVTAVVRGAEGNKLRIVYADNGAGATSASLVSGLITVGLRTDNTTNPLSTVTDVLTALGTLSASVTAASSGETCDPGTQVVAPGDAGTAVPFTGGVTPLATVRKFTSGAWSTAAAQLADARGMHTSTLLHDGKIAVLGGSVNGVEGLASGALVDTALTSGTAATVALGSMAARFNHTASLLPNGRVLVVGGSDLIADVPSALNDIKSVPADLANANIISVSGAGAYVSAPAKRTEHNATVLPTGEVLVHGGIDLPPADVATTEVFDPTDGAYCGLDGMTVGLKNSLGLLYRVPSGQSPRALVAYGRNASGVTNQGTIFDPTVGLEACEDQGEGEFTESDFTGDATRTDTAAVLLRSGRILVAGGRNATAVHATTRLLTPSASTTLTEAAGTDMSTTTIGSDEYVGRYGHTLTLLPDGRVLAIGGIGRDGDATTPEVGLQTIDIYDPTTNSWGLNEGGACTNADRCLAAGRAFHRATLFQNAAGTTNFILVTGGLSGPSGTVLASAEVITIPSSGPFTVAAASGASSGVMATARFGHTAVALGPNRVLVAYGRNGSGPVLKSQVYTHGTGWSAEVDSNEARDEGHASAVLFSGKVLSVAGGLTGNATPKHQEIYDPESNTFFRTATDDSSNFTGVSAVWNEVAQPVMLPSGKVLVAGGSLGGSVTTIARAYSVNWFGSSGAATARRPSITTATDGTAPGFAVPGGTLTLTGTQFAKYEAGGGNNHQSSSTAPPFVHLQGLQNDLAYTLPAADGWTDTSLSATVPATLVPGHYRLSVVSAGVASTQRIILIGKKARGVGCANAGECDSGFCSPELVSVGATKVCCERDCTTGFCTAGNELGAAGVCTLQPIGSSCTVGSQCASLTCTGGTTCANTSVVLTGPVVTPSVAETTGGSFVVKADDRDPSQTLEGRIPTVQDCASPPPAGLVTLSDTYVALGARACSDGFSQSCGDFTVNVVAGANFAGAFNIKVQVKDGSGQGNETQSICVPVTITQTNSKPILAALADPTFAEGAGVLNSNSDTTQHSHTVSATDADTETTSLTFTVSSPANCVGIGDGDGTPIASAATKVFVGFRESSTTTSALTVATDNGTPDAASATLKYWTSAVAAGKYCYVLTVTDDSTGAAVAGTSNTAGVQFIVTGTDTAPSINVGGTTPIANGQEATVALAALTSDVDNDSTIFVRAVTGSDSDGVADPALSIFATTSSTPGCQVTDRFFVPSGGSPTTEIGATLGTQTVSAFGDGKQVSANLIVKLGPNSVGVWCIGTRVTSDAATADTVLRVTVAATDSPTIVSLTGSNLTNGNAIALTESTAPLSTTTAHTNAVSASDVDSEQSIALSLVETGSGTLGSANGPCDADAVHYVVATHASLITVALSNPSGTNPRTASLDIKAGPNSAGKYCYSIRATDSPNGGTASDFLFQVTVAAGNAPPVFTSPSVPATLTIGTASPDKDDPGKGFTFIAGDPDSAATGLVISDAVTQDCPGNQVGFATPNGFAALSVEANTNPGAALPDYPVRTQAVLRVRTRPNTTSGDYVRKLQVTDGDGATVTTCVTIQVNVTNSPPTLAASADPVTASEGVAAAGASVSADDLNAGQNFLGSVQAGTPGQTPAGCTNAFPPFAVGPTSATALTPRTCAGGFVDGSCGDLPLTFTPGANDAGTYSVKVEIQDRVGTGSALSTTTQCVNITVAQTNSRPVLAAITGPTFAEGSAPLNSNSDTTQHTQVITATDADTETTNLTFTVSSPVTCSGIGGGSGTPIGDPGVEVFVGFRESSTTTSALTVTTTGSPDSASPTLRYWAGPNSAGTYCFVMTVTDDSAGGTSVGTSHTQGVQFTVTAADAAPLVSIGGTTPIANGNEATVPLASLTGTADDDSNIFVRLVTGTDYDDAATPALSLFTATGATPGCSGATLFYEDGVTTLIGAALGTQTTTALADGKKVDADLTVKLGPNAFGVWCIGVRVTSQSATTDTGLKVTVARTDSPTTIALSGSDLTGGNVISLTESTAPLTATVAHTNTVTAADIDTEQSIALSLVETGSGTLGTPNGPCEADAVHYVVATHAGAITILLSGESGTNPRTASLDIKAGPNSVGKYCYSLRATDSPNGGAATDFLFQVTVAASNAIPRFESRADANVAVTTQTMTLGTNVSSSTLVGGAREAFEITAGDPDTVASLTFQMLSGLDGSCSGTEAVAGANLTDFQSLTFPSGSVESLTPTANHPVRRRAFFEVVTKPGTPVATYKKRLEVSDGTAAVVLCANIVVTFLNTPPVVSYSPNNLDQSGGLFGTVTLRADDVDVTQTHEARYTGGKGSCPNNALPGGSVVSLPTSFTAMTTAGCGGGFNSCSTFAFTITPPADVTLGTYSLAVEVRDLVGASPQSTVTHCVNVTFDACNDNPDCASARFCDTGSGKCQSQLALGQLCDSTVTNATPVGSACSSNFCATQGTGSTADDRCCEVACTGGTCNSSGQCSGLANTQSCVENRNCNSNVCTTGTCQPCTANAQCTAGNYCVQATGFCAPLIALGGLCSTGAVGGSPNSCASGFCADQGTGSTADDVCCESACTNGGSCGASTGNCTGSGKASQCSANDQCASNNCVNPGPTGVCCEVTCASGTCNATTGECTGLPNAGLCTETEQCSVPTDVCTDGRCCQAGSTNRPATCRAGSVELFCHSCAASGTEGTCTSQPVIRIGEPVNISTTTGETLSLARVALGSFASGNLLLHGWRRNTAKGEVYYRVSDRATALGTADIKLAGDGIGTTGDATELFGAPAVAYYPHATAPKFVMVWPDGRSGNSTNRKDTLRFTSISSAGAASGAVNLRGGSNGDTVQNPALAYASGGGRYAVVYGFRGNTRILTFDSTGQNRSANSLSIDSGGSSDAVSIASDGTNWMAVYRDDDNGEGADHLEGTIVADGTSPDFDPSTVLGQIEIDSVAPDASTQPHVIFVPAHIAPAGTSVAAQYLVVWDRNFTHASGSPTTKREIFGRYFSTAGVATTGVVLLTNIGNTIAGNRSAPRVAWLDSELLLTYVETDGATSTVQSQRFYGDAAFTQVASGQRQQLSAGGDFATSPDVGVVADAYSVNWLGGTNTAVRMAGRVGCQLAQRGDACQVNADCANNTCKDGRCCENACADTTQCRSCNLATPQVSTTLFPASAGCPPGSTPVSGVCQGNTCTTDVDCPAIGSVPGRCNAQGKCSMLGLCLIPFRTSPQSPLLECGGYACTAAGACRTTCTFPSNSQCASGYTCSPSNTCLPAGANGSVCTDGGECDSTFCVDGKCCDRACSGQCETCNGAVPGTCSFITGGTQDPVIACVADSNPGGFMEYCSGSDAACNARPQLSAPAAQTLQEAQVTPTEVDVVATDANNDQQLTFTVTGVQKVIAGTPTAIAIPAWVTFVGGGTTTVVASNGGAVSPKLSLAPDANAVGSYIVALSVADSLTGATPPTPTASTSFNVTVTATNSQPVLTGPGATTFTESSAQTPPEQSFNFTVDDPDGADTFTYALTTSADGTNCAGGVAPPTKLGFIGFQTVSREVQGSGAMREIARARFAPNWNSAGTYCVRITATDNNSSGGAGVLNNFVDVTFSITAADVAPTISVADVPIFDDVVNTPMEATVALAALTGTEDNFETIFVRTVTGVDLDNASTPALSVVTASGATPNCAGATLFFNPASPTLISAAVGTPTSTALINGTQVTAPLTLKLGPNSVGEWCVAVRVTSSAVTAETGVRITVAATDSPSIFTSSATRNVNEATVPFSLATATNLTVTATDLDLEQTLTLTSITPESCGSATPYTAALSTAGTLDIQLTSTPTTGGTVSGTLAVKAGPNANNANGYCYTVQVDDGLAPPTKQTIIISVLATNADEKFLDAAGNNAISTQNVSLATNDDQSFRIYAGDPDSSATLTFSEVANITGCTGTAFTIAANAPSSPAAIFKEFTFPKPGSGATETGTANYATRNSAEVRIRTFGTTASGTYARKVQVTDGTGAAATLCLSIEVAFQNSGPVLSHTPAGTISALEDTTNATVTILADDPDASQVLSGRVVTDTSGCSALAPPLGCACGGTIAPASWNPSPTAITNLTNRNCQGGSGFVTCGNLPITFTPGANDVGTFQLPVLVQDAPTAGLVRYYCVPVTVGKTNTMPVVAPITVPAMNESNVLLGSAGNVTQDVVVNVTDKDNEETQFNFSIATPSMGESSSCPGSGSALMLYDEALHNNPNTGIDEAGAFMRIHLVSGASTGPVATGVATPDTPAGTKTTATLRFTTGPNSAGRWCFKLLVTDSIAPQNTRTTFVSVLVNPTNTTPVITQVSSAFTTPVTTPFAAAPVLTMNEPAGAEATPKQYVFDVASRDLDTNQVLTLSTFTPTSCATSGATPIDPALFEVSITGPAPLGGADRGDVSRVDATLVVRVSANAATDLASRDWCVVLRSTDDGKRVHEIQGSGTDTVLVGSQEVIFRITKQNSTPIMAAIGTGDAMTIAESFVAMAATTPTSFPLSVSDYDMNQSLTFSLFRPTACDSGVTIYDPALPASDRVEFSLGTQTPTFSNVATTNSTAAGALLVKVGPNAAENNTQKRWCVGVRASDPQGAAALGVHDRIVTLTATRTSSTPVIQLKDNNVSVNQIAANEQVALPIATLTPTIFTVEADDFDAAQNLTLDVLPNATTPAPSGDTAFNSFVAAQQCTVLDRNVLTVEVVRDTFVEGTTVPAVPSNARGRLEVRAGPNSAGIVAGNTKKWCFRLRALDNASGAGNDAQKIGFVDVAITVTRTNSTPELFLAQQGTNGEGEITLDESQVTLGATVNFNTVLTGRDIDSAQTLDYQLVARATCGRVIGSDNEILSPQAYDPNNADHTGVLGLTVVRDSSTPGTTEAGCVNATSTSCTSISRATGALRIKAGPNASWQGAFGDVRNEWCFDVEIFDNQTPNIRVRKEVTLRINRTNTAPVLGPITNAGGQTQANDTLTVDEQEVSFATATETIYNLSASDLDTAQDLTFTLQPATTGDCPTGRLYNPNDTAHTSVLSVVIDPEGGTRTPGLPPSTDSIAVNTLRIKAGPNAADDQGTRLWCFRVRVADNANGSAGAQDVSKSDSRVVKLNVVRKNTRPDLVDVTDRVQPAPTVVQAANNLTVDESTKPVSCAGRPVGCSAISDAEAYLYKVLVNDLDQVQNITLSVQPGDPTFCQANSAVSAISAPNTSAVPSVLLIETPSALTQNNNATAPAPYRSAIEGRLRIKAGPSAGGTTGTGKKYCLRVRATDSGSGDPVKFQEKDVLLTVTRTNSTPTLAVIGSGDTLATVEREVRLDTITTSLTDGQLFQTPLSAADEDSRQTLRFESVFYQPATAACGAATIYDPAVHASVMLIDVQPGTPAAGPGDPDNSTATSNLLVRVGPNATWDRIAGAASRTWCFGVRVCDNANTLELNQAACAERTVLFTVTRTNTQPLLDAVNTTDTITLPESTDFDGLRTPALFRLGATDIDTQQQLQFALRQSTTCPMGGTIYDATNAAHREQVIIAVNAGTTANAPAPAGESTLVGNELRIEPGVNGAGGEPSKLWCFRVEVADDGGGDAPKTAFRDVQLTITQSNARPVLADAQQAGAPRPNDISLNEATSARDGAPFYDFDLSATDVDTDQNLTFSVVEVNCTGGEQKLDISNGAQSPSRICVSGDANPLCSGLSVNRVRGAKPITTSSATAKLRIQPGPNASAGEETKAWCFGIKVVDGVGGEHLHEVRLTIARRNSTPILTAPSSVVFDEAATTGNVESPADRKGNPPDSAMPLVTFNVSAEDFDDGQDLQFTIERPGASNACGDAELVPLVSTLPDADPDRRDYWLVRTLVQETAGKRADQTGTTRTARVQLRPRPNDQGKYCVRVRVVDQGAPAPVETDVRDVVVNLTRTNSPLFINPLVNADDAKNVATVLKKSANETQTRVVVAGDYDREQTLTFRRLATCPTNRAAADLTTPATGPSSCLGQPSVPWMQLQGTDAARPLPTGSRATITFTTPDTFLLNGVNQTMRTEPSSCMGQPGQPETCQTRYCFCFEVFDNATPTPSKSIQMTRIFVKRPKGGECEANQGNAQCVGQADLDADPSLAAEVGTNAAPFCVIERTGDTKGVCCNGECTGSCKSCVRGTRGECTSFAPNERDDRTRPGSQVGGCVGPPGTTNTSALYTCQAGGSCRITCSSRRHCDPDRPLICSGGQCVEPLALGASCGSDVECASSFCADMRPTVVEVNGVPTTQNRGVCCNARCAGGCQTCRRDADPQDGICAPKPRGTPALQCGSYTCNGAGQCLGFCNADNDCTHPAPPDLPDLPKYWCDPASLLCKPKLNPGEACVTDAYCKKPLGNNQYSEQEDGYCADGRCCEERCDGQCVRCSQALTQQPNGACAPLKRAASAVVAGTASFAPRSGALPPACGAYNCGEDGQCLSGPPMRACASNDDCGRRTAADGSIEAAQCVNGVCAFPKPNGQMCTRNVNAECQSRNCTDEGLCCKDPCNGPCKACSSTGLSCDNHPIGTDPENGCNGFTCDGAGACRTGCTADTECRRNSDGVQSHVCIAGACTPRIAVGACTEDKSCLSGFCTGGFCCGSRVCGEGETCESGQCRRPKGSQCDGDDECVTGACVGGFCCADTACGRGEACSTGVCKKTVGQTCAADDECERGNCVSGICCESECENEGGCRSCSVPGKLGKCTVFSRGQDPTRECGELTCDGRGDCLESCQLHNDCRSGFFCASDNQCEPKRPEEGDCDSDAQCQQGFCIRGNVRGVCDASKGRVASGKIPFCSAAEGLEGRGPWLPLVLVAGALAMFGALRRRRRRSEG